MRTILISAGVQKLESVQNYLFRGVQKFGAQKFIGTKIKGIKVCTK